MSGRKRIPTKLKLLKGTNRADRENKNEPNPLSKIPVPPSHLSDTALIEWGRVSSELMKLGLLSEIDMAALAAYCQSFSRWAQAEEKLKTAKLTIETESGNVIQNPLVGIANKAMDKMLKCLVEFGMTPSSRSKVTAHLPDGEDEWDGY